jgi:hypothetical protein
LDAKPRVSSLVLCPHVNSKPNHRSGRLRKCGLSEESRNAPIETPLGNPWRLPIARTVLVSKNQVSSVIEGIRLLCQNVRPAIPGRPICSFEAPSIWTRFRNLSSEATGRAARVLFLLRVRCSSRSDTSWRPEKPFRLHWRSQTFR